MSFGLIPLQLSVPTGPGRSCDVSPMCAGRERHSVTGKARLADDSNTEHKSMGDLKDPRWMYLKAILFFLIIIMCAGTLWMQNPQWQTALLILWL